MAFVPTTPLNRITPDSSTKKLFRPVRTAAEVVVAVNLGALEWAVGVTVYTYPDFEPAEIAASINGVPPDPSSVRSPYWATPVVELIIMPAA